MTKRTRSWFNRRLLRDAIAEAGAKAAMKMAADVEREAKLSMKAGGGEDRIPSPPGTPPHVQTGTLRSSITHAQTGVLNAIIGPTAIAWYGRIHEYGEEYGGRNYPARPFMFPAVDLVQQRAITYFRKMRLWDTKAGKKLHHMSGIQLGGAKR